MKNKQHHVWKAYLRAWATKEKLWVWDEHGIRCNNIEKVAVERHFYKLQLLTPKDIEFIRRYFISPTNPMACKIYEDFLTMFSWPTTARAALSDADVAENPQLAKLLDEMIINIEEDYHCYIENKAAPLIAAARGGDISFFEGGDNAMLFAHFISLQHFRTKGVKDRIVNRFKENLSIDVSRCWNIISHILAIDVGISLFLQRQARALVLLRNETSVSLITSDQPTVNLHGGAPTDRGPEYLSFYYPISPKLALLLDEPSHPCGLVEQLTERDVERLNKAELLTRYRQAFGNTKEAIARYAAEGL
jgi:hypothetical protein